MTFHCPRAWVCVLISSEWGNVQDLWTTHQPGDCQVKYYYTYTQTRQVHMRVLALDSEHSHSHPCQHARTDAVRQTGLRLPKHTDTSASDILTEKSHLPTSLSKWYSYLPFSLQIVINDVDIIDPLSSALLLYRVSTYRGLPCHPNPCQPDKYCVPIVNNYACYVRWPCQVTGPLWVVAAVHQGIVSHHQ